MRRSPTSRSTPGLLLRGTLGLIALCVALAFLGDPPPLEGHEDTMTPTDSGEGDPIPFPEAKKDLAGEKVAYPLQAILVYKKLPSYSQADCLDRPVAEGKLPPVKKRLPEEPQVLLASSMSSGLGQYGGVWRDVSACPTEGWNWGAGQTQGWFGINGIVQEPLLRSGPIFLRSDAPDPLPNLAKDWHWSEDGTKLTMGLIRGARWSDGHPFTSDDVMFTWEDLILDPNVRHWTSRTSWQIEGKDIHLVALDEYTIQWTFPAPFPVQLLFQMDALDFSVSPAHVLRPHHPKYNQKADYVSFENCLPPQDLPPVVLGPWVPVHYKTDELLVMRRNPYYWKVDEKGQQLPYLDEVVFEKAGTGLERTFRTLAGAADHSNLENPSSFVETTKRLQDPHCHFQVEWGPETLGFSLFLNQSATLGVKTERDAAMRTLFRDVRFRRALSQAIDREGLCNVIVRGPFLRPWPGGLYPGSPYFDRETAVYYPYSPLKSKALLADLGFEDTDGDGFLNWTRGPLSGDTLMIALITTAETPAATAIAEAMVPLLDNIGIQVHLRFVETTGMRDADENGRWEMRVSRMGQDYAVPFSRALDLAPIQKEAPSWHREGKEPRHLQAFEKELIRVVEAFRREPSPSKRRELIGEYNRIYTENLYSIGLVVGRYGLALAKRFRNIPAGAPAFLHQWTWNNVMAERIWVPPEERVKEIMPDMIPLYQGRQG